MKKRRKKKEEVANKAHSHGSDQKLRGTQGRSWLILICECECESARYAYRVSDFIAYLAIKIYNLNSKAREEDDREIARST